MIKKKGGFTLIELLVVVAIIAILAGVAIPKLLSAIDKAKQGRAFGDIGAFNTALQMYFVDHNNQWITGSTLTPLETTYMQQIPVDPWGTAYNYVPITASSSYSIDSTGNVTSGTCKLGYYALSGMTWKDPC